MKDRMAEPTQVQCGGCGDLEVRRSFAGQPGIPTSERVLYDGTEMDRPLKRSCPHCSSVEVFRSHRRGFIEKYVLHPFRMRPYRCVECDTRFYALADFRRENSSTDQVA
jgi:hypothetical protein